MFILTKTQILFKNTCKSLALYDTTTLIDAIAFKKNNFFEVIQIKKIINIGLISLTINKRLGGGGATTMMYIFALEEVSKICLNCSIKISFHNSLYCEPIFKYGTIEQKQLFLLPFIKGEKLGIFALTQFSNEFNLSISTLFINKYSDRFILHCLLKNVISYYKINAIIISIAIKNKKYLYNNVLTFIIPIPYRGLLLNKNKYKNNLIPTYNIIFYYCKISKDFLLNNKLNIPIKILINYHICLISQLIGIAQVNLRSIVKFFKTVNTYSFLYINIKNELSYITIHIEQVKLLLWKVALLIDKKHKCITLISMSKLTALKIAIYSYNQLLRILQQKSMINLNQYYKYIRIIQIWNKTNKVQKLIVAFRILKKYYISHLI